MGWVVPAIIAGKGIIDYFSNRNKEKDNVRRARTQYDQYYSSPYYQALVGYLRQQWADHGMDARLGNQPGLLDSLLRQPRFDSNDPRYKIPGAGGRLGGAFMDAIAAYYTGQNTGGTTPVISQLLRGGSGGGNTAAAALYGSGAGSMSRPGSAGLFSGDGASAYPGGTAIGEGLPGGPAETPARLPAGPNYGPSVGAAMGTSSRGSADDADPYDAESILQGILQGQATPGSLFGGTPGQFDGSGAAYATPLRRALRVQGL